MADGHYNLNVGEASAGVATATNPSMPIISAEPACILCFIRCSINVLQEIQQIQSDHTTRAEFQLCNIGLRRINAP